VGYLIDAVKIVIITTVILFRHGYTGNFIGTTSQRLGASLTLTQPRGAGKAGRRLRSVEVRLQSRSGRRSFAVIDGDYTIFDLGSQAEHLMDLARCATHFLYAKQPKVDCGIGDRVRDTACTVTGHCFAPMRTRRVPIQVTRLYRMPLYQILRCIRELSSSHHACFPYESTLPISDFTLYQMKFGSPVESDVSKHLFFWDVAL
jgi:hypothetical protein